MTFGRVYSVFYEAIYGYNMYKYTNA